MASTYNNADIFFFYMTEERHQEATKIDRGVECDSLCPNEWRQAIKLGMSNIEAEGNKVVVTFYSDEFIAKYP